MCARFSLEISRAGTVKGLKLFILFAVLPATFTTMPALQITRPALTNSQAFFFFKSQVNGQVIGRASGVPRETPRQPVRTWRDLLERTASTVCGWG